MTESLRSKPPVGFIGLGAMGFAMSTHLVRQGVSVTGYDIWEPTLKKFEDACERIPDAKFNTTTSPAEAVRSAAVVILMVATHHHVNSALFDSDIGAITSLPLNCTVIITSTVPPTYPAEVRRRLDEEYSRPDVRLIDAPVSGGTVRSANGTLTIMASSNDPQAFQNPDVQLVLQNISSQGKTLFIIPGTLGAGTSAKALNQVQCGVHIVSGSEIMALAAVMGLDTGELYNKMRAPDRDGQARYGWTWMFENRGPRMLDPNLPISSAVSIINKDVGIIHDEESRLNVRLPILDKAFAQLAKSMEAGMAAVDDAWISRFYLGLQSEQEMLIVARNGAGQLTGEAIERNTDVLLLAHAIINFQSAYETFLFAEALELLGESQREMWFTIIAGAAGGSRIFSEVIPAAFEALASSKDWRIGFKKYAENTIKLQFGHLLNDVANIVERARTAGVQPELLETALQFLESQTT